jgi:hypothetical protein
LVANATLSNLKQSPARVGASHGASGTSHNLHPNDKLHDVVKIVENLSIIPQGKSNTRSCKSDSDQGFGRDRSQPSRRTGLPIPFRLATLRRSVAVASTLLGSVANHDYAQ